MKKLVRQVRVNNHFGLHARPAAVIVKMLQGYKNDITFTYKGKTINAKSILNILTLAAKKHALITITIIGENSKQIMDRLVVAFKDKFGESSENGSCL